MTEASSADITLLDTLDHAIEQLLALELDASELRIELAKRRKNLLDRLTALRAMQAEAADKPAGLRAGDLESLSNLEQFLRRQHGDTARGYGGWVADFRGRLESGGG